jgi:prephenate dehydrogenase
VSLQFKQVVIVGVGLIGGSLGMHLKRHGLADSVVGVGRRPENLKAAVQLGAIDRYVADGAAAVDQADLVVLATPVDTYEHHLRAWGPALPPGCILTDVGSVKGPLVGLAERLIPPHARFVGAHPIAGKEKTGVTAGSADLFRGARCVLTPTARTDAAALSSIQRLWESAGSTVVSMDPFVHDKLLGAVSHLPHVAAYCLMNALGALQDRMLAGESVLAYAGGGLRDTTRIAASSPEMWRDIFLWNRENVLTMIDLYEGELDRLKSLIQAGDGPGIEKQLAQAKQLRERLH